MKSQYADNKGNGVEEYASTIAMKINLLVLYSLFNNNKFFKILQ